MGNNSTRSKSNVETFRPANVTPTYSANGVSVHEFVGERNGAEFSGGLVRFKDSNLPFKLWYDELLVCTTVEDVFEVVVGSEVHNLLAGDAIWLPADTELIYRSKGLATAYFMITPVDWKKKLGGSG